MKLSREHLRAEARSTGFRAEILEKVFQSLNLLGAVNSHPFLKGRLALKGGTALNLFLLDLPRLSVDVDWNYVGAADRETMGKERPVVEDGVRAVCGREGFQITRVAPDHAGGRWGLRYESALGQGGNLEIDINFMFRVPLWPVQTQDSRPIGSHRAVQIPVLDLHELAAGKLAALLARRAARDLFDVHQLLTRCPLDRSRLRLAFVVYGGINRKDWRTVSIDDVDFEVGELKAQLIPVMRTETPERLGRSDQWATRLVSECREALWAVLPLNEQEREFLDRLLDHGEIKPSLVTDDQAMAERIAGHPALEWKARNVRAFKSQGAQT